MRSSLSLLLFIVLAFCSCKKDWVAGNSQIVEFNTLYGGSQDDAFNSIAVTKNGDYTVVGYTSSNDGDLLNEPVNLEVPQAWVSKLDNNGKIIWKTTLGNSNYNIGRGIIEATDGGYVMAGVTRGPNLLEKLWLVKFDESGKIVWNKTFGGTSDDAAFSLVNGIDGGYVIVGNTKSSDGDVTVQHGEADVWVIKVDKAGSLVWQKSYGGRQDDGARDIISTTDGNYLVCGQTESNNGDVSNNHGMSDGWIIKIDPVGNLLWQKTIGGSQEEFVSSLTGSNDGGYLTVGYSYSNDGDILGSHGGGDGFVEKLDNQGNKLWSKTYGGSNFDAVTSITEIAGGNFLMCGGTTSADFDVNQNLGKQDAWILKINSQGKLLNQKTYGGSEYDVFWKVLLDKGGGEIFLGTTASNNGTVHGNHGNTDGWIMTMKKF